MKKILGILALMLMALLGIVPAATAGSAPAGIAPAGIAPAATAGSAPAPTQVTATDIVVEDTAGVLYLPQLMTALEQIKFHEPTTVVIYTRNGARSDNFNEKVLQFAREKHPEWITADGQKWADGLFIFAFDPAGRQVGTYMGEDRKVSLGKQESIQQASKELFLEAQWTDGTIAGVKKGASLINQPWYLSAAFIITASVTGGLAALGFGTVLIIRRNNRKKAGEHLKRGDAAFSSVSLALDVTELNAKTIPESSTYGSLVLEKYRTFSTRYHEAGELNQRVHSFTDKDMSKGRNVKIVARYAELAQELDNLDDVIADTNTLLNRYSGWESAWERQVRPLMDDMEQLPALIAQPEAQGLATTAALASLHAQRSHDLEQLGGDFQSRLISPEAALDRLKVMRAELTALLQQHSELMIGKYAKTSSEKKKMRSAMERSRQDDISMSQATIFGSIYGWNSFYSVHSFNSGYITAQRSVDTARSDASSGSSTGYGSSGGSFSGSGSSSSF
ncbi:DUF5129 domain-containing protein [Arthrobacter sp. TMP15]|uniref:DUF5129 domain-containing protein n=1 Tax=Arthrobacter sp. TMP15 TaxID=3140789 RepID=UPI0031B9E8BC